MNEKINLKMMLDDLGHNSCEYIKWGKKAQPTNNFSSNINRIWLKD